jgi:hypothetical protein
VEWFLRVDNNEKFSSLLTFLGGYDRKAHEELLPLMLPHFSNYARFSPIESLGFVYEGSPVNQRRAFQALLALLDSENPLENAFACRSLAAISGLSNEELQRLGDAFLRFRDKPKLQNPLLLALSSAGQDAAFMQEGVTRFAQERGRRNHPEALSCLANISDDPAVRKEHLDLLMELFRQSTLNPDFSQSYTVRSIGLVRGQEERVIPFLHGVVDAYLAPQPDRNVLAYSADLALWALSRQRVDADLFSYYRNLLRRLPDEANIEPLLNDILWCLIDHFEDRLPEVREEMDRVPMRLRANFGYRKISEKLQRLKTQP